MCTSVSLEVERCSLLMENPFLSWSQENLGTDESFPSMVLPKVRFPQPVLSLHLKPEKSKPPYEEKDPEERSDQSQPPF
jgi:hypothetical protein